MVLSRIEVRQFRNLASVSLSPAPGLNVIEGRNASGKTSFLEAIHMLALARSFRTSKAGQLIREGNDDFLLFATLDDTSQHRLGLQRFSDNRMQIRLDGQTVESRATLVHLLPLQLITPDSLSLLTGSPGERRRYLDWMMFHVEHGFHQNWMNYQRYLKQRNALLRTASKAELPFWTKGLIEEGLQLTESRIRMIANLRSFLDHYTSLLLPGNSIKVSYLQGWKRDIDLAEALGISIDADIRQKHTTVGPHRADLVFTIGDQRVQDVFSRGQLKLLLCALKLAQLDYTKHVTGKSAVVLIDDLPAELDEVHRRQLLALLHDLNNQVFVTSTDRSHLDYAAWSDVKVFHVEHGKIEEVV